MSSSGSPRCAISQSRMARIVPLLIEQEIAGAVIAMDDGDLLGRRRRIAFEPADGGMRDGLRLKRILADDLLPARQFMAPAILRIARAFQIAEPDGLGIGPGDAAEIAPELLADRLAMRAIGIGAQGSRRPGSSRSPPSRRRAAPALPPSSSSAIGSGTGRPRPWKALIGAEFGRAFGFDQARRRIAPQDQRAIVRARRLRYSARGSDRSAGWPRRECARGPSLRDPARPSFCAR